MGPETDTRLDRDPRTPRKRRETGHPLSLSMTRIHTHTWKTALPGKTEKGELRMHTVGKKSRETSRDRPT